MNDGELIGPFCSPMKSTRTTSLPSLSWLLLISLLATVAKAQVEESSFLPRETAKKTSLAWTRVAPATEKFAVMMPGDPTVQKEGRVIDGQQVWLSYYGSIQGESDYAVLTGLGLKDTSVAQMLMLDLYCRINATVLQKQSVERVNTTRATYQRDIFLNGYIGRQFSLEAYDRIGEWRIYRVGETFYAVAASTSSKNALPLKRFLDSFTFSLSQANAPGSDVDTSTGVQPSAHSTFRWLIILQTFSKAERPRAIERMSLLRNQGYDTHVIDTDSYPNLRPGFLALTIGPCSKRAAAEQLGKLRLVAPQSYIKSGW
jgi:hypothetical protein